MSNSQTCGKDKENEQGLYNRVLTQALAEHDLPRTYLKTVQDWLEPIAENINSALSEHKESTKIVLGVQGTQGSGKSTCSDFIKRIIETRYNKKVAVLSIDDFYLTRSERQTLAKDIHPLLETRGVPGTHDVDLAIKTINNLLKLKPNEHTLIPRFDKSVDDRSAKEKWSIIEGPVDLIILEGWCIGLNAQTSSQLLTACNDLEKTEDTDKIWRTFVNDQLKANYQTLFSMIDRQLTLRAPSFACVYQWRLKQEQKLIHTLEQKIIEKNNTLRTMSEPEIKRFISHYERLTEHALNIMPEKSNWCLWLDEDQSINKMTQSSTQITA